MGIVKRVRRHAVPVGLVVFLVAVFAVSRAASAQPIAPILVVPNEPVTAGGSFDVWLVILNTTGSPVSYAFPARLEGRLRSGTSDRPVSAALQDGEERGDAAVPPGGYARRRYLVEMPDGVEGQVVLSLSAIAANPVALEVRRAEVVARAAEEAPAGAAAGPVDPPTEQEAAHESAAVEFFREHFSGYEPLYFIVGPDYPNAKFQISFKYQVFSNTGPLAKAYPAVKGLHIAYTQMSLWDLTSTSKPFVDTSYKPEVFYGIRRVDGGRWANWLRLDLQAGLQHHSNGKSGDDSRSLNAAYFEPTLFLGDEDEFHVSLAPRVWAYLGSLDENPDIKDYYGNVGVRSTVGWGRNLLLSATGRIGNDANRGSIQFDLSFPLMRFLYGNLGLYLYAQYFLGYGESLLRYNERTSAIRFGFSLFR
jgi:outer membrane phospholipase A